MFAGTTDCAMPYTYTSLVFLWLVTLGLFAVSASGVLAGSWLMLLPLIALATPALILRRVTHAPTIAPQLAPAVGDGRRRRRLDVAETKTAVSQTVQIAGPAAH